MKRVVISKALFGTLICTTWLMTCCSLGYAIKSMELEKDLLQLQADTKVDLYQLEEKTAQNGDLWANTGIVETEYIGKYDITYYCSCEKCCGKADGITASGNPAIEGYTVAMEGYPFGTQVLIDGSIYTVQDRFGADVGKSIDVYVAEHEQAREKGTHQSDVYLVKVNEL